MWYPAPPCNEGHIRMEGMSHRHVLKLEAKENFTSSYLTLYWWYTL